MQLYDAVGLSTERVSAQLVGDQQDDEHRGGDGIGVNA